MKKTTKTKLIAAVLTSGVFLAGFTSCRSHKDDKTTAAPTTTEDYNINVPQTEYGPPEDYDETTTEEYDPSNDVPQDVYGPPEDFE